MVRLKGFAPSYQDHLITSKIIMFEDYIENYISVVINKSKISRHHAVIIQASSAVARRIVAQTLKQIILGKNNFQKHNFDELVIENNDSNFIKIEQVRGIFNWLSKKKTDQIVKQIVTIHEAQSLTLPAQNALLKVLEEPPQNSFFILTVSNSELLSQTVKSRCQMVIIPTLSKVEYIKTVVRLIPEINKSDLESYFYISRGDIIFTLKVLIKNNFGQLLSDFDSAKRMLNQRLGDSVIELSSYQQKRPAASQLVENVIKLLNILLINTKDKQQKLRWAQALEQTLSAREQIDQNVNLKLILDKLLLEIRV